MWHRNQFCSVILFAFGLGIFVGHVISSAFLCTLLVVGAFVLGVMSVRHRW